MKCKYCGEELPKNSNFCKYCGKKTKIVSPWKVSCFVLVFIILCSFSIIGVLIHKNNYYKQINCENNKPIVPPKASSSVDKKVEDTTVFIDENCDSVIMELQNENKNLKIRLMKLEEENGMLKTDVRLAKEALENL